jgi:hypothetical protein
MMAKLKARWAARRRRRRMEADSDRILMPRLARYTRDAIALQPRDEQIVMRTALDLGQWSVAFEEVNGVESIGSVIDGRPVVWIPLERFDPDGLLGWKDKPRRRERSRR